jgi:hypothetical protein
VLADLDAGSAAALSAGAAVLGALVGAAGGAFAAWLTMRSDDQRTREERMQTRLTRAYEVVMLGVTRTSRIVQQWQIGSTMSTSLSDDAFDDYQVQASLFGTAAFTSLLHSWARTAARALFVIRELAILANRQPGARDQGYLAQWQSYLNELDTLRAELATRADAVIEQSRRDLGTE